MIPALLFAGALGGAIYLAVKGKKRVIPDPNAGGDTGGDGGDTGGSTSGKGRGTLPPPPLPFTLVREGNGAVLDIKSLFGTYGWATKKALEIGATSESNASDVLRMLASSLPGIAGRKLTGIRASERPVPNDEEWDDIMRGANEMTWGQLMTASEKWLQEKGLG